jgi:hypothetical protein
VEQAQLLGALGQQTLGLVDTPLFLWGQLGVQLVTQLAKLR